MCTQRRAGGGCRLSRMRFLRRCDRLGSVRAGRRRTPSLSDPSDLQVGWRNQPNPRRLTAPCWLLRSRSIALNLNHHPVSSCQPCCFVAPTITYGPNNLPAPPCQNAAADCCKEFCHSCCCSAATDLVEGQLEQYVHSTSCCCWRLPCRLSRTMRILRGATTVLRMG